ncbi:MAG TPA: TonB family protein [Acidobacteriaceae bacterium]|nr:TonB family protein [Acidobacteriaceae bacterium]
MLFSPDRLQQRRPAGILFSLGTHGAVLLIAFLFTLHFGRVRPIYRDSRCCTAQLYWTGNTGVSDSSPAVPLKHAIPSPVPQAKTSLIENPVRLRQPRTPRKPATTQNRQARSGTPSLQQQQTIGTGSGSDDAEPAFPTFFPRPAVTDRSLLPAVEQKIIVNVTISAQGDVTGETLVQGLGNNLDSLVLETVKTWRFHPATLNGNNVASVEQLVFPFNRDYPSDDGAGA